MFNTFFFAQISGRLSMDIERSKPGDMVKWAIIPTCQLKRFVYWSA